MPVTHLLDTSVYSQPIRKQPHAEVIKRWQALGDTALVRSAICEAEVLFGIRKKGSTKLANSYETILKGRYDALPLPMSNSVLIVNVAAPRWPIWIYCSQPLLRPTISSSPH
jgi:predicted nucleic acid-binding protein